MKKAQWDATADVRRSYATASIVTGERIVFNIKGNAYRLVVAVDFAVMKDSGGLRKLRWGVQGSGKRGGLRIIYYWPRETGRIYFMAIYRKNEVAELTKAELRQLKSLLSEIEIGRSESK